MPFLLAQLGVLAMVTKICRYDGGVCRFPSCEVILPSGDVVLCGRHKKGNGRSLPRLRKSAGYHIFNKHRRLRR